MLYPFMTLPDETEIVHSEVLTDDGKECVKVCIEKPVIGGFHSAICWLPDYRWEDIHGFTEEEISRYQVLIQHSNLAIAKSD
ncbi:MAG: hypothetical protein IKS55_07850 [Oscillospiraceae bacterium]|nr:hypothetical protein [Oscillospiraceae bacterium]